MVDEIDLLLRNGGPSGHGYVRGRTAVDPGAWFFRAHFFQDPVWPGSLGLESLLQLLKVFAVDCWGEDIEMQSMALGHEHRWTYRGQVIPDHREVTVETSVTSIDDDSKCLTADGFLSVDGRVIYKTEGFTLQVM